MGRRPALTTGFPRSPSVLGVSVIRSVGTRVVYASAWMTVREDRVTLPDGGRSRFGVVSRAPFVTVLAVGPGDRILLVRQFRYAVGRWMWELPQGALEPGEGPVAAAGRELLEETGRRLESPAIIGAGLPEAGDWATQTFAVVAGRAVADARGPRPERSESTLTAHETPLEEIPAMIRDGRLADPPSLAALHLWHLGHRCSCARDGR
jgi:8-oxo-dGTP pyrophosphatase MutT (NUDIX family)